MIDHSPFINFLMNVDSVNKKSIFFFKIKGLTLVINVMTYLIND